MVTRCGIFVFVFCPASCLTDELCGPCLMHLMGPGPEVIKRFSCSTQLSMKISLLINMKMPTIVGIFIFISRDIFMLSYGFQERNCNCQ